MGVDQVSITQYILDTFADVDVLTPTDGIAAGDSFFTYADPQHMFPFTTIVTKDYGDFDCASNLNRPGVFRLNIGVSKNTFRRLFGEAEHDFAALDRLFPHPVYAPQSWVSVLNPSKATFQMLQPLLAEAYGIAVERHARRKPAEAS
jgi:hypothetical protein